MWTQTHGHPLNEDDLNTFVFVGVGQWAVVLETPLCGHCRWREWRWRWWRQHWEADGALWRRLGKQISWKPNEVEKTQRDFRSSPNRKTNCRMWLGERNGTVIKISLSCVMLQASLATLFPDRHRFDPPRGKLIHTWSCLGNIHVNLLQAQKLSEELVKYTKNTNNNETAKPLYWPVVKCVTVKVPNNDLLRHVTLVDLPGNGDCNKERNQMWGEVISKLFCTSICIFAFCNTSLF